jgi:sugar O-acyltransferase (sialic acid O-acetyltransferase NeuD family)
VEPTPLVIVGAGGHGRELLDIVEAVNAVAPRFVFEGFCDDSPGPWPLLARRGVTVVGTFAQLGGLAADYVVGLGRGRDRQAVDERATAAGRVPASLVHPLASQGRDLDLGPGLVMAAGARITTNVAVGRHVHLNLNATLSHDCRVGDYVTLNPGANVNGAVTLGDRVTVGSGAVIREGTTVGADVVIGAGAVVVEDAADGATVVGVPARPRPDLI